MDEGRQVVTHAIEEHIQTLGIGSKTVEELFRELDSETAWLRGAGPLFVEVLHQVDPTYASCFIALLQAAEALHARRKVIAP